MYVHLCDVSPSREGLAAAAVAYPTTADFTCPEQSCVYANTFRRVLGRRGLDCGREPRRRAFPKSRRLPPGRACPLGWLCSCEARAAGGRAAGRPKEDWPGRPCRMRPGLSLLLGALCPWRPPCSVAAAGLRGPRERLENSAAPDGGCLHHGAAPGLGPALGLCLLRSEAQ